MALDHCESGMRKFVMVRNNDYSGVSGTGVVLEGVVFTSGQCVVHWLSPAPNGSIAVWSSFEDFESVHISSHPDNKTEIRWFKVEDEEETIERK